MLEVTELLNVAQGASPPEAAAARAPARYDAHAPSPPVVVWNVCRHCVLHCPHCYAAATATASPHDLTTTEARRLIDGLADVGVRVLILSGGEPLLREDLVELAAYAGKRGLRPLLSTSGVLLDARTAGALAAAGVSYVGVSLDGLAAFNDAYRGMAGGFARAADGLACAKAAGMSTGVRLTITSRNVAEVEPLLRWAAARGVDRFYVSHLLYSGRGLKLMSDDLQPAESRVLLDRLFDLAEGLALDGATIRIVTGGNDSDGPYFLGWVRARYGSEGAMRVESVLRRRGGNSAGERVIAIDHRGRVHPDQFSTAVVLGDVRQQPLAEILAHPLRAELRDRETLLQGRCSACAYRPICRGSHRERALAHDGDFWAPDPACVMTDAEIGLLCAGEAVVREEVVA